MVISGIIFLFSTHIDPLLLCCVSFPFSSSIKTPLVGTTTTRKGSWTLLNALSGEVVRMVKTKAWSRTWHSHNSLHFNEHEVIIFKFVVFFFVVVSFWNRSKKLWDESTRDAYYYLFCQSFCLKIME